MTPELRELVSRLPASPIRDESVLLDAGRRLHIEWPADYVDVVTAHNGVEGDIGDWLLVLTAAEDLVEVNENEVMEFFPGLVMIGGDGGGEALALHRETGEVILAPWIAEQAAWLVLGSTFTEALNRMFRGEVFDAPTWSDLGRPIT